MTATVEMPFWLVILVLVLAAIATLDRIIGPGLRWFLRRRMERAVEELNKRLERPIQPFRMMRRQDQVIRLIHDPQVMEAAVVAAPDATWGEVPHAFVTLKPEADGQVSEAEIIAWCRDRLAHFKAPKHATFGPLPKTATGKIQKFELRARLRASQ